MQEIEPEGESIRLRFPDGLTVVVRHPAASDELRLRVEDRVAATIEQHYGRASQGTSKVVTVFKIEEE